MRALSRRAQCTRAKGVGAAILLDIAGIHLELLYLPCARQGAPWGTACSRCITRRRSVLADARGVRCYSLGKTPGRMRAFIRRNARTVKRISFLGLMQWRRCAPLGRIHTCVWRRRTRLISLPTLVRLKIRCLRNWRRRLICCRARCRLPLGQRARCWRTSPARRSVSS